MPLGAQAGGRRARGAGGPSAIDALSAAVSRQAGRQPLSAGRGRGAWAGARRSEAEGEGRVRMKVKRGKGRGPRRVRARPGP